MFATGGHRPPRVVVKDGLTVAVNPDKVPDDARIIAPGVRTFLPGLIDMHT